MKRHLELMKRERKVFLFDLKRADGLQFRLFVKHSLAGFFNTSPGLEYWASDVSSIQFDLETGIHWLRGKMSEFLEKFGLLNETSLSTMAKMHQRDNLLVTKHKRNLAKLAIRSDTSSRLSGLVEKASGKLNFHRALSSIQHNVTRAQSSAIQIGQKYRKPLSVDQSLICRNRGMRNNQSQIHRKVLLANCWLPNSLQLLGNSSSIDSLNSI